MTTDNEEKSQSQQQQQQQQQQQSNMMEEQTTTTEVESPSNPSAAAAAATSTKSFEEKVASEIEKAKSLKISEMKLKLQSKGILTSGFCEKPEFIRAYAECIVKEKEEPEEEKSNATNLKSGGTDDDHDSVDDDDEANALLDEMPMQVQHRIGKLMEYDKERDEIMKQYLLERAQLEAKYHSLVKPLYEKRKDVVQGKLDEEIQKEHEEGTNNGDNKNKNDDDNENQKNQQQQQQQQPKGIPQFWVCAMGRMDVIGELVSEADVDALDHLKDIRCDDDENGEGFTLSFHFTQNEYFENNVLTKRYEIPNLLLADEPILKNVYGCDIQWKPNKCLTFKTIERKQRGTGKNAGQVRAITRKEKSESFFHFFTPPQLPSMDDMDEERAAELESAFNDDYDVAQALRSHVIPKAIQWFAGKAMEEDMEAVMKEMEQGATPSGDEQPPECKQS